jgi:hypothetical protein
MEKNASKCVNQIGAQVSQNMLDIGVCKCKKVADSIKQPMYQCVEVYVQELLKSLLLLISLLWCIVNVVNNFLIHISLCRTNLIYKKTL